MQKLFVPVEPQQAGVVPYRVRDGRIEFLLITSRKRRRWLVPKGKIEGELGPRESARREGLEEAGVEGPVAAEPIGSYRHGRSKRSPIVTLYLLRVEVELESWPEQDVRARRWETPEDARRRVSVRGLEAVLAEAESLLRLALSIDPRLDRASHPALPG